MKAAIRALLLANSGVAAIVGDRIAWGALPRGTAYPAIALHLISGPRHYAMSGPSGLVQSRVQVDCCTESPAAADALARVVRRALDGIRTTVGGVMIQGAFLDTEADRRDEEPQPPSEVHHDVLQDYLIWHTEDVSLETLNDTIIGAGGDDVIGAG